MVRSPRDHDDSGSPGADRVDRRSLLRAGGALIGGIAVGPTVVGAAESEDRYLLDTRGVSDRAIERADVAVVHDLDAVDLAVVRGSESDVEAIGGEFAPDAAYEIGLPNDGLADATEDASDEQFYPLQWDKQTQDIPSAHEIARGEGTRVAVIDDGIDPGHPDLLHAVNETLSRNFTDAPGGIEGTGTFGGVHGTHVSGIIAADDRNDAGVVGSAPGTELVMCRVFSEPVLANGTATFGDIVAAIAYSAEIGCDVANLSLGAYPLPRNDKEVARFFVSTLNRLTNRANSQGTLLVAAAGNDAADLQHDKNFVQLPGEAPNVMSISATGPLGFLWDADGEGDEPEVEEPPWTPAEYTNYGTNVIDVSAPGGRFSGAVPDAVLNTVTRRFDSDNPYRWLTGTSMAAPQVAGAAALVKSANSGYDPNQVRTTIERTADDKGKNGRDPYHGAGFVDPLGALEDATGRG